MLEDHHQTAGYRDDSYQLGALADPQAELERLERQARVAQAMEIAWLRQLGIAPDARVLDVGCGPGFMSEALAELVPDGRVVGVDADLDLLREGRRRLAGASRGNVRFVHASVDDLPIESATSDIAYARFLFQHLPRPVAALREIGRVVAPGGRVVVVDTDDGGLVLHPQPEGLPALLAASRKAQSRRGGDRTVGRKLRAHMVAAGLERVRVEVVPFTSDQVGMAAFLDICLGFKSHIIEAGELSPQSVSRAMAAARALIDRPDAFGHALAYVAVGHTPD
jgi:SAM-dependent methyltransferase